MVLTAATKSGDGETETYVLRIVPYHAKKILPCCSFSGREEKLVAWWGRDLGAISMTSVSPVTR